MKKILIISSLFLFVILGGCRFRSGSGIIISETRDVGRFVGVDAAQGFDVVLSVGPESSVKLEADDNIISLIRTEVDGNILKIRLKRNNNFRNATLKAYITAPFINDISASSGATVKCMDDLKSDDKIRVSTSSAGTVECRVQSPEIELKASSGSEISISGRTRQVRATASSGSDINAFSLLIENVFARSSSGSDVELHASIGLDMSASSGSSIRYRGGATDIKSSESSGGSVSRSN